MSKTALIVGATGIIGQALLAQLCQHPDYQTVIVWTHQALPAQAQHPKITEYLVDFNEIAHLPIVPVDDVFCAFSSPFAPMNPKHPYWRVHAPYANALARWAKRAQAQSFVFVSAHHAHPQSFFLSWRAKGLTEQLLRTQNFPDLLIVRPFFIIGESTDWRFTEYLARHILSLLPQKWATFRPLSGQEIARAIILALKYRQLGERIIQPYCVLYD